MLVVFDVTMFSVAVSVSNQIVRPWRSRSRRLKAEVLQKVLAFSPRLLV